MGPYLGIGLLGFQQFACSRMNRRKELSSEEARKAEKPTTETAAGFAAETYLIFMSEIRQADQEAPLFFTPWNVGGGQIISE